MPMFMNTATSWSSRLAGIFTAWSMFIILTEIKLITGLKILNSEIKEYTIKLKQFAVGKIIQVPLGLTNRDVLSQELKDMGEGGFVKDMPLALIILIKWTRILCGTNFAIALDNINPVFWGILGSDTNLWVSRYK